MITAANLPGTLMPLPANREKISTALATEPFKKVRKNHQRKKKLKPEKVKPAKAKLPNGNYFWKKFYMKRKDFKKMQPGKDKEPRKKMRGARNKEAARLAWQEEQAEIQRVFGHREKKPHRIGKPMYSKPAGPHRLVIYTQDICSIMGMDRRPAGRYLTRLRKKLKMPRGSLVPLSEFLNYSKLREEDVIPHLK
jgi:hypothetical protein